jgi:hypothetical protein
MQGGSFPGAWNAHLLSFFHGAEVMMRRESRREGKTKISDEG